VIRLVALNQDTQDQTTLDLEGSPSISLNLAVAKPGETMQRHAPYSQTFRLPFTDRNNLFFAHFYEVTLSDGDFDPTQKTEVLIFEDGVQVIRGSMQLRAVRLMAQAYEVNVLGDVADLFAEMGSKLLKEAFNSSPGQQITSYNYEQTEANFILSQDLANNICQNPAAMDAGTIIIPLADHGLKADQQPIVAEANYGLLDSSIQAGVFAEMMKPAIRLREVFDRVLNSNGFVYTSNFISGAYFETIYMTLGDERERVNAGPVGQCKAVLTGVTTLVADGLGNSNPPWQLVPLNSTTLFGGFDTDANFNTGVSAYFCAEGGTHRFAAQVQFTLLNGNAGEQISLIARITRGTTSIGSATGTISTTSNQATLSFISEAICAANDAISVQVYFTGKQSGSTLQVTGGGSGQTALTFFLCTHAPGGIVNVPSMLPRIKQKEFMADLCQRFNLVIEADPDNPTRLYIEPYEDWLLAGSNSYWTDKLDLDKERTLSPTSSLKASRITLSDKDSPDVGNAYYTSTLNQVFGTYDQDIDDDFATGELKNAPVFAPFFVYPVPTLGGDTFPSFIPNVLIHRSYELEGVGVKPVSQPPKLFHALGLQTSSQTMYIGGSSFTQYQFCSAYEETGVNSDSRRLYWNSTGPLPYAANNPLIGANPGKGLHRTYWASYLADIYDADARVFEAHLYLTPDDIRRVRFNDRFHILGATYKLTEISGYQIGTGESTLCKFLRDLGRSSFGACDAVPTSSNANGTVTFTNPDGTTTTNPGQQCCEAFGYFYDAETNTCRWSNPGTDEGDPVPPYPPTDSNDPTPNYNGDGPQPVTPTGTGYTTTDPDSGTVTRYDQFILSAETTSATAVQATAPGGAALKIDTSTIAAGVIRVTSTTVGGTAGVAFTTSFETWRFLANGYANSIQISEMTGESLDTGSPGLRRLSATLSNGEIIISVTGSGNKIINWSLSIDMVRIYATNQSEFEDAMVTEAGARLAGINDRVLLQE